MGLVLSASCPRQLALPHMQHTASLHLFAEFIVYLELCDSRMLCLEGRLRSHLRALHCSRGYPSCHTASLHRKEACAPACAQHYQDTAIVPHPLRTSVVVKHPHRAKIAKQEFTNCVFTCVANEERRHHMHEYHIDVNGKTII